MPVLLGDEVRRQVEEYVKTVSLKRDASHDWAHTYRVRNLARTIARQEGASDRSYDIIELAALLHDVADSKYSGDEAGDLANIVSFLEVQCHFDADVITSVMDIIQTMGFKNKLSGKNACTCAAELAIVQDADMLDAIGAIGIARCFTYGGAKHRILYDPDVPPREHLTAEQYRSEQATTINHFYEKLLKLKDMMQTNTGKQLAQQRHDFMVLYLEQFYSEWQGQR